jgi:hypothetical protein
MWSRRSATSPHPPEGRGVIETGAVHGDLQFPGDLSLLMWKGLDSEALPTMVL